MKTPLGALLWELWRVSRWELALRLGLTCTMVVVFCGFASTNLGEFESAVVRSVMLMVLLSGSAFSNTWTSTLDNRSAGFCFRLGFSRPISTTKLVITPMLFSIGIAVVSFLAPALIVRALLGPGASLGGLTAFAACFASCLVACAWAPSTRQGKFVLLASVLIGFIVLLVIINARREGEEPWLMAMGQPGFFRFDAYYYAACLGISCLAVIATLVGVERQRHGDGWVDASALFERLRQMADIGSGGGASARPFRSTWTAQLWYECRRVGRTVMPTSLLVPMFPLAFIIFAPLMADEGKNWDGAPGFWIAAILFCPLIYQLVGAEAAIGLRHKQGAVQLSAFDATRPVGNVRLIVIKLVSIAVCGFAGLTIMALVAALHSLVAGHGYVWAQGASAAFGALEQIPVYWWGAAIVALLLGYISGTSVFLAFGLWMPKYPYRLTAGLMLAAFQGVFSLIAYKEDWFSPLVWNVYGYLIAVAIVGVCLFILWRAQADGYLMKPYFAAATCMWIVYSASAVYAYREAAPLLAKYVSVPPPMLAILASSLLMSLAAATIAPLALGSHRHA